MPAPDHMIDSVYTLADQDSQPDSFIITDA